MANILVADDDTDLRDILVDLLTSVGHSARAASDGEEVIQAIAGEVPDLLVLDLSMPRLDGWTVARRLRASPDFGNRPIIALTAHALSDAQAQALSAGCDVYIAKPFSVDTVVATVNQLLASYKNA